METLPYKNVLIKDIESTFGQLYKALSAFDDDAFNQVPFERSWTAGQVTEHIIKATGGIPDQHTKPAHRPYDEKVSPIKAMFLNFNIKFEADT